MFTATDERMDRLRTLCLHLPVWFGRGIRVHHIIYFHTFSFEWLLMLPSKLLLTVHCTCSPLVTCIGIYCLSEVELIDWQLRFLAI